jgi:non-specific serine/threonine protein kinase/serine/threonine-protein kinase
MTTTVSVGEQAHPMRVGPYRIIQMLGEGGMGVVFEAEEMEPVRRRVALKLVRAGHDTREVLARFDAERRALAVMNHACIAKVLGAGTTETGQPYFAMELVRGLPITLFCDARRLPIRDRLLLFISVCEAVQHAHQKGVIHRDLKPSNILVSDEDGHAQPKVIDFGIAKALGPTGNATLTMSGMAVGTAAYMSPEQANSGQVDVDTRADIYSLGVMLYELLVGHLPVDPNAMGLFVFLAQLVSGHVTPPAPSVGLLTVEQERDTVAHKRRTDFRHLRRELKGDLDWIIMKAMQSDRALRYETANGLAADLRRYLSDEPVAARPPSTRYRITKFVRRHRVGVIAAGTVFVTVVASAIVSAVGYVRATRAEQHAAEEAEAAKQVTNFLVDLFRVSDPGESRGNTLTAREILDRGTKRVTTELAAQPLLQARIMQTMGSVHAQLGQYGPARTLLADVLRAREQALPADDPLVAETLASLGEVARSRGDADGADRLLSRALAIRLKTFGPEHIDVASTLASIAALRWRQGRAADAESLYKRVLLLDKKVRTENDPRVARDMRGLAAVYYSQKRYGEAEQLWKETLALQERTFGGDHPDVASTRNNLGGLYYSMGRFTDAQRYYQQARPVIEKSLGPLHPITASVINNLAEVEWKLKHYGVSEELFRRALTVKEQSLTADNPSLAVTLNGMAGLLRDQGRTVEAEPLYQRALSIRERALGSSNAETAETLRDYAALLVRAGRRVEAQQLLARLSP